MQQGVTFLPPRRIAKSKIRLIEAGVRLFTGEGGKSPTTREVAAEAGLNHALISYHFKGMSDLMAAVVEHCISELRALFVPELEAFETLACKVEASALPPLLHKCTARLLEILAGPKGAALLRALSSPEASAVSGAYERFSDQILEPLHHAFALTAAKARAVPEESLEAVVLAQCMVAQSMAFFRGARPVLNRLGKKAFSPEELRQISRIVSESLCRAAGLNV